MSSAVLFGASTNSLAGAPSHIGGCRVLGDVCSSNASCTSGSMALPSKSLNCHTTAASCVPCQRRPRPKRFPRDRSADLYFSFKPDRRVASVLSLERRSTEAVSDSCQIRVTTPDICTTHSVAPIGITDACLPALANPDRCRTEFASRRSPVRSRYAPWLNQAVCVTPVPDGVRRILRTTPLARPGAGRRHRDRSVVWHGDHFGTIRDLQLGTGEKSRWRGHAEYRLEYRLVSAGSVWCGDLQRRLGPHAGTSVSCRHLAAVTSRLLIPRSKVRILHGPSKKSCKYTSSGSILSSLYVF